MKYKKQYTCLVATLLLVDSSRVSASRFLAGGVEQFDEVFGTPEAPVVAGDRHGLSLLQQRSVPDIEKELDIIAQKEPMLRSLEKKIPEMNKMEKTLQHISHGLDHLVDPSDMVAAQEGRETIKKIY